MSKKDSALETIIGGIVLIFCIGFVIVTSSMYDNGEQTKKISVSTTFDNCSGISVGSDIRIAGVKVGRVTHVSLDPQDFISVVKFTVPHHLQLPKDSTAAIRTGGFVGSKYIDILPGGEEEYLRNGDQLRLGQSAMVIESLIEQVMLSFGKK